MIAGKDIIKSVGAGLAGMAALVLAYWLILYLITRDPNYPVERFAEYKYWISFLLFGFGVQVGLYWFLRTNSRAGNKSSGAAVAASAGVSTMAMAACCAHHLVDILPFLGLSAAALFLSRYQTYFFILGAVSNVAGIIMMLRLMKK